MKFAQLRKGLAIYDPELDVIQVVVFRSKRRFERVLRKRNWNRQLPGVRYQATYAAPDWKPMRPVPQGILPYTITKVFCAYAFGGHIVQICWHDNKKKAQRAFRKFYKLF